MRKLASFAAYTALLMAVVITPHWIAYNIVPMPPVQGGLTIVQCATEDSTNCFWDASEQGNGQGQDLWN